MPTFQILIPSPVIQILEILMNRGLPKPGALYVNVITRCGSYNLCTLKVGVWAGEIDCAAICAEAVLFMIMLPFLMWFTW